MNAEERYMAKIIFKNRVLQYKGQQFEDFFVDIMTKANIEFQAVKAYGNIGDKKNDGFVKTTGSYYQVFAPEDITKDKTIYEAVAKMENDFIGLVNYWNNICHINEYYFVINDKYEGIPVPIIDKIIELGNKKAYSNIKISIFSSKNLEAVFDELSDSKVYDIIGLIPNIPLPMLEYEALQETVTYLTNIELPNNGEDNLIVPDFEEKIIFNDLSETVNNKLVNGSYQEGLLHKYFNENPGIKEILQGKFHALYEKSKENIPETEENYADCRFFYILDEASSKRTIPIQTSVTVLMAFYFSSCDIFEEPK